MRARSYYPDYTTSIRSAISDRIYRDERYERPGIEKKMARVVDLVGEMIEKLAAKGILSVADVQSLIGDSEYKIEDGDPE